MPTAESSAVGMDGSVGAGFQAARREPPQDASSLGLQQDPAFLALSPVNLSTQFICRHPEVARKCSLLALIFGTLPDDDI